jgi:hypothetical protein
MSGSDVLRDSKLVGSNWRAEEEATSWRLSLDPTIGGGDTGAGTPGSSSLNLTSAPVDIVFAFRVTFGFVPRLNESGSNVCFVAMERRLVGDSDF